MSNYFIIKEEFHKNGRASLKEWNDGLSCWYNENGLLHRENGPAFISSDGSCAYCLNGSEYANINSDEEWIIKQILE